MATDRLPIKVRLAPEVYAELFRLHPSYGEASRVARELISTYILVRKTTASQVTAMADAVLSKARK